MIVGVGIDLLEISRIRKTLSRRPEKFRRRILTEGEKKYCSRFADPAPEIAARFAAKEAFMKAIGTGLTGGVSWRDIEVVKERKGPPRIRVRGRSGEVAAQMGVNNIHLSITHSALYSAAYVIIEKN